MGDREQKSGEFPLSQVERLIALNARYRDALSRRKEEGFIKEYLKGFKKFSIDSDPQRKLTFVPFPMLFPASFVDEMSTAGETLLNCQRKIIKNYIGRYTREEICRRLGLGPKVVPYMDWDMLVSDTSPVVRFDFLFNAAGSLSFCEFNVDTSVGGAESYRIAELFMEYSPPAAADILRPGGYVHHPYEDLARMLEDRCERFNADRVVFLGWDLKDVYCLGWDTILAKVKEELPSREVVLLDRESYLADIRQRSAAGNEHKDVVYRIFIWPQVMNDPFFLEAVRSNSFCTVTMFESLLLLSKVWFALFHEADTKELLSSEDLLCIERYIPRSVVVTEENIAGLLRDKGRYMFKEAFSFGGAGVISGRDLDERTFAGTFEKASPNRWIAQEFLPQPEIPVMTGDDLSVMRQKTVFGLYGFSGRYSGLLVRSGTDSDVLNVKTGASMGWTLALEDKDAAALIDSLERPEHKTAL